MTNKPPQIEAEEMAERVSEILFENRKSCDSSPKTVLERFKHIILNELNLPSLLTAAKERDDLLKDKEILRSALTPFASGISVISWGVIKANLPVHLAAGLTRFNYLADKALEQTAMQKGEQER